jgi:probable HAF family extracellular repeat protein
MRYISCAILMAAVGGCGSESQVTQPPGSTALLASGPKYEIHKLSSPDGTQSRGMAINSLGWVAGWSDQVDGIRRAILWRDGSFTRLGSLGGPGTSSTLPWPGLNDDGLVVGISQTKHKDPLGEDWSCEFGSFLPNDTDRICRGFVWENGEMRELTPLGGHHSFAAGVNNLGQVVGWAETPVRDPTCDVTTNQKLQFRGAVWDAKARENGRIKPRELRPFADDSTSAATAINDNGYAVGISGDCDQAVGRRSAKHAVLWDKDGNVSEIPNLGGTTWHTPMAINEQGDVVGFGNPPGGNPDDFNGHAFLWINGSAEAKNLGKLEGNTNSQALGINSAGRVVGLSNGGTAATRGFLYEDGVMFDLNLLIDNLGPDDVVIAAHDINEAGQITGRVLDGASSEIVPFIATPIADTP